MIKDKISIFNYSFQRQTLINASAYIYLGIIIITSIIIGMPAWLFILFSLLAIIFIIPSPHLGIGIILVLTMLFERFFTLQPLSIGEEIYKIYPLDVVIGVSFFALILKWRQGKLKNQIKFAFPEIMLLFFICLNVIYFLMASLDINAQLEVAFSTLKNYAFYPLLYYLILFGIQNKQDIKKIIYAMALAGIGIIGFLAVGVVSGQGLWTEYTPLSTEGTRLLAGTHAFYLLLISIIGLSLIAFKRFWSESFATIILWIWIFGIMVSLMRHLWLALVFGAGLLFLMLPRKNKKNSGAYVFKNSLVMISLVLATILFFNIFSIAEPDYKIQQSFYGLKDRLVSLTQTEDDSSASWRVNLWKSAGESFATNPFFGVGTGRKIALNLSEWQTFEEIRNLHNSLLAILVQMGILGLVSLMVFVGSVITFSRKHIFKDEELFPYYLGIIACIGIFLFVSLFQPYFETNLFSIFFWIMLGLLATARKIK